MTVRRVLTWLGLALVTLAVIIGLAVVMLDSDAGRSFAVRRLAAFETASGLSIHVRRIDGSLYGRMVLRDVEVRDNRGTFLTSPAILLDWRPFAYVRKVVDVRELSAGTVRLLRRPALKPIPSDPNAPILPDIDVAIAKLDVRRLILEPPVTGQRHIVQIAGSADIADGRARISAKANALKAAGVSGGDSLTLTLDAVPDKNRLVIDARLVGPAGGLVDSYAKLGKPIDLQVGGRGSWANWSGALNGALGGKPFAKLALTARDGTFTVRGRTLPALLLPPSAQYLVETGLDLDLTAKLSNRRADTRLLLRSNMIAASVAGLIDLGQSRFGRMQVDARLLEPGAMAKNLSGSDIRLLATLDGPFAQPSVDYRLTAAQIAFAGTGVDRLIATGKARIDPDRIVIPLSLRAARVTGLNPAIGGLLLNVAVDGDLAYAKGRLLSDNLRIRSSRIDATAVMIADIARGRYTGAIKGRVNNYRIDGVGRVDLTTDAKLVNGAKGGFGVTGLFRMATRQLDNAGLQNQLGGQAILTGRFGFDENGVATVTGLRMVSPKIRILDGRGSYRPDGSIRFSGQGVSSQYGPVSVEVTGTAARPIIHLVAARPNVGVALRDVSADVVAVGGGYQVRARGQSAYGPFTADVLVRTGGGPLTIDLHQVRFAEIDFRGRIVQTAAGPFAGDLTLAGAGLNGSVRLAAAGAFQRADLAVTASNARIPGDAPITIGAGMIRASLILYPNAPAIVGSASLTNVRQGLLNVARMQGRIDYRGGKGRLGLIASGATPSPFEIAMQAALSPTRVVANARGSFNRIPFRLAAPAVVTKAGNDWVLAPATLIVPQGQARLSGRYGRSTALHADLDNLDVSIAEAFSSGLGLGGKASGTVDVALGGAVPKIDTKLTINRFTRTAAYSISSPVDVALLGSLSTAGGDLRALIQRGPTVIGRLQARLAPLGAGTTLQQRLMNAPLAGGIRYNGPAEVLWTLTGDSTQQLSGPIVFAADFVGRVGQPTLVGVVRANALRYDSQKYGTRVTDIAMLGRFTQSRLDLISLNGRAGRGTVAARGTIGLDAASGFPIDLNLQLDNAQLAKSDTLGATATGTLAITNGRGGGAIKGNMTIPEARYEIVRQGAAEVADLTGVRRKSDSNLPARPAQPGLATDRFKLDLTVRADNRIFVSGMGLEAEWQTRMRITGTSANPVVVGRLELVRGTYSFAGRRFELAQQGEITFDGGPFNDPLIAMRATTTVEGVTAVINITGRAQRPQIAFTSTPQLAQDEVLSRLLFGSSVTALSPTQAIQLAAALNSLRGSGGGLNPLGKLRSATGISRLRILGADKTAGRGTALAAGKYISNNIYIEVITDARGFTATQLEIALSRTLSILSQTGTFGGSNVNLRYSKNY